MDLEAPTADMHPRQFARATPAKPAYIMASTGETVTYAELERQANRVAHWLRFNGVRTGDVVALQIENHPRLYEFIWGAQRTGAFYLLLPTSQTPGESIYMLENSGAVIAVLSSTSAAKFTADLEEVPCPVARLNPELAVQLQEFPDTPVPDEQPGADMLYSSGTTGVPKGIQGVRPPTMTTPDRATILGQEHFSYDNDTVFLCPAPLYHAAPLRWSLAVQRLGGTVILMERFDAESALRLIEQHRVTVAQFVPTHMARMLALPDATRARYDLSSLKCVFHAGAPCPASVKRGMIEWVGPIVSEFYSGSEGLGITIISADEWLARPGSVGTAKQGSIRICGSDGEPLPFGQTGLVRFADVRPFAYHNDPDKTAAAYDKHGWPTLGDIGYLDEEGYLFLTDRTNFTIISGGVNIYPREIEDHLVQHPLVADVGVVGLPDEEMGEIVTAFVEPTQWPVDDQDKLAAELDAFARGTLSPVKVPRRYIFQDTLGRTETGKLLKRSLKESFLARAQDLPLAE